MAKLLKKRNSDEYGAVFYLKPVHTEIMDGVNELRMELCTKYIPMNLKDSFVEKFGNGLTRLTEEEINKFIEENN